MIVSAISKKSSALNTVYAGVLDSNTRRNDKICDMSFNSLSQKKSEPDENLPQILENINDWKNFCHQQIMNGKLDIIA